jgi:AcrR family transcriptional regulator
LCLRLMGSLAGNSEREWVLLGMAECCAEKGYEATSVADVCAAAGVSEGLFAEFFAGKDECMGAAMEWLVALAWRKLDEDAPPGKPWAERLRAGVESLLGVLSERPAFARLVLIEAPVAGGRAAILRESARKSMLDFIESAPRPAGVEIPASAGRAALAGVEALVSGWVLRGNAEHLAELAPEIIFMLAVPFLGRAEASRLGTTPRRRGHLRAVA